MNSTNQHYLIKSLMMVIVGMLCCSNVVSAFVVGNTAISMASVISLVFLIITIIFNHGQIVHLITYITSDLKWTFAFIILSTSKKSVPLVSAKPSLLPAALNG